MSSLDDTRAFLSELEAELSAEHRAVVQGIERDTAALVASIASRSDATKRASILNRLFKK